MLRDVFIFWGGIMTGLLIAAVILSGSDEDRRRPSDKDDIDYSGGQ